VTSAVDAPATTTENENKSPANVNNEDMVVEAVAESNQGSESEIQCGICFDDIACRGVIDSCEHTYCFTCIHSWSKVTNLCPFCKQRFKSIQKKTLKGQPAKDENKKLSIKNKTQQQPDNFDIRDFISSEEEYDSFEDAEDDPEDGEYRGRNILPASVRSQIQLLARNYQRRGFNVNIELFERDPPHIIIDDEAAVDEEVVALGHRSRRNPPQAGAGSNRARNNNNRRRRAMEEAEMADFIVPDEEDWEMQSTELSYASEELSDDEIMADEPRKPAQKRKGPAATNNSRSAGRNNNPRRANVARSNNAGSVTRAPKRPNNRSNSKTVNAPIALDDDIPIIDATGEVPLEVPFDGTMSQEDALAIAQALQDIENESMRGRDQRRINYDSEDDEITLRSHRKVRRT
jgi:hypothetical protein